MDRLVVGISGASGVIYGVRFLEIASRLPLEISKRIAVEELRKLPFDFRPVNEALF